MSEVDPTLRYCVTLLVVDVGSCMNNLVALLEKFDRKERPLLFRQATSIERRFKLSPEFRQKLEHVLDLPSRIPEDSFVAFDYHLNWLFAALRINAGHQTEPAWQDPDSALSPTGGPRHAFENNQEDVDLLVAWGDETSGYDLVLVEAKAYSGWSNKQMQSKQARLELGFAPISRNKVRPHLVLASFNEPKHIKSATWPIEGVGLPWIPLLQPGPRLMVGRSNELGEPAKDGGHWAVRTIS